MGQNSTEVAYGFGQMGSAFSNLAAPIYPPKDHVIVAIQFVGDNALTVLETETLDTIGPQFITHQDDELASAGGPDANYLGVYEAAASGGTAAGVITIADVAGNTLIKSGQIILIGADDDGIDTGLDSMDTGAGHFDPIYQGPNRQYLEVVSLTGGTYGTTLQVKAVGAATLANLASIDGDNTIYFLDSYHGAGGSTIESVVFPKGLVLYGRWTKAQCLANAKSGMICYFGK